MEGKSAFALLLAFSRILRSVVVAVDEPFCTSKFDFEEKLLYKVMRLEHALELLQREVRENLTEFDKRQPIDAADDALGRANCRCPNTWIRFKGSCYLFLPDALTFAEAEYKCNQHSSHLVKINDDVENAFLKTHCFHLKDASHWTGLTDESIEDVWEWRDRSNPGFVGWNPSEPNGKRRENCVVLFAPHMYNWVDIPCTAKYSPICETELTSCPLE